MQVADPVVVRDLDVFLGGQQILFGLDLRLQAGEAVGILGGNGSGKTTLLRSILNLTAYERGAIELYGTPLGRFHDWQRVGYVPQLNREQVPEATVKEMIEMGLLASRKPFIPLNPQQRRLVADATKLVGMTGLEQRALSSLSGGQRQRVMLGRALVNQPDLIVMDEPLTALDLAAQAGLADELCQLKHDGKSLLVVVHEIGPLEGLLDRTIRLVNGRVADEHTSPLPGETEHACT